MEMQKQDIIGASPVFCHGFLSPVAEKLLVDCAGARTSLCSLPSYSYRYRCCSVFLLQAEEIALMHKNVTIVRYKRTIIFTMNGALTHSTTLPTKCEAVHSSSVT